MKLLVDCTPLSGGGGVQVAIAFIEGLRKQQAIDWHIVVPRQLQHSLMQVGLERGRVTVLRKASPLDLFGLNVTMRRIESRLRPDVVFTVFGPAYFNPRAPHVVGFALPNLLYERDGPMRGQIGLKSRIRDTFRRIAFRRATALVVETETARRRLASHLSIDPSRIAVIQNAVNPKLLACPVVAQPSAGTCFSFLVPSAYYVHKNLEVIPGVAAALQRMAPAFQFEFRLTLDPNCAPWKAMVRRAQALGVADKVKTLGALSFSDLGSAYGSASAVFLPTLREISTAVYPESFHFRRPLITTDLDFARELCGEAATYVSSLDPGATAQSILSMIRSPEQIARQIEAGSRQLASQYLDADSKYKAQIKLLASAAAPARFAS